MTERPFTIFHIKDLKFETDECKTLMVYPANPEQTSEIVMGLRRMLRDGAPKWMVVTGYNHIGSPILCRHDDCYKVMCLRLKFQFMDDGVWNLYIPDKYLGPEPLTIGVSTEGLDYYHWSEINKLNNYVHYSNIYCDNSPVMRLRDSDDNFTCKITKPTDAIEKLTQEARKGLEKFKYEYAGGAG